MIAGAEWSAARTRALRGEEEVVVRREDDWHYVRRSRGTGSGGGDGSGS
jgi:hypothetical protein